MKFFVTCSEGEPQIVEQSELRNTVHRLFCSCSDPANCENAYLAEFDEHDAEDIAGEGIQWDCEDSWVNVEPIKESASRRGGGNG